MARILLTHTPEMFRNYYGERALARLREQGEVRLHSGEHPLAGEALVAAAQGCEIVVSDFKTPGDAPVFEKSPQLVAFLRCAVDIRTIDVAAASRAGVLVTRASPACACPRGRGSGRWTCPGGWRRRITSCASRPRRPRRRT